VVEHYSNLDCPESRSTEISDSQVEPGVKADSLSDVNTHSNNKSHDDNAVSIDVISSACWFLHTKLNNKEMPMLFDTGSPVSIISVKIYESIGLSKPDLQSVDSKLFMTNSLRVIEEKNTAFRFETHAELSMKLCGSEYRQYNRHFPSRLNSQGQSLRKRLFGRQGEAVHNRAAGHGSSSKEVWSSFIRQHGMFES